MDKRDQVIRNTVFSSLGIYTEYFLGMLTSIIIARHLGPAEFGTYSLVIWLVATGMVLTNSGVASAVIKFVAELRGAGRQAQIRPLLAWAWRVQGAFLAVVLAGGTAVFVLHGQRLGPEFNHAVLLAILLVTTALRASYMLNIAIAKGFEDFRVTAAVAVIVAPLNLLLILVVWWLDGPMEWFLGTYTASSFAFWWISRRKVEPLLPPPGPREPLEDDLRKRLRSYTALVAVTVAISFITASEIEVLFLTLLDSAASAGHFKVAFQLASGALLLVPGVFGALLLPMMANALAEGREVAGRRMAVSTTYLCALAAPLVALGVVFAEAIIGLLYGEAFAPAAFAFGFCLATGAFSTLSQAASGYLLGSDRQRTLMFIVLGGAIVKIALDIALIQRFGLNGAVVAYGATSALMGSVMIGVALYCSGARLEWGRMARVLLAALLAAAIAWAVRGQLAPLPGLLLVGILLSLAYVAATLVLGFWSAADLQYIRALHSRFAKGRPAFVARLLGWAERRAGAPA